MKFFFDNTFPPRLVRVLDILLDGKHVATHLKDKFKENTLDEVWLPQLSAEGGWAIITSDDHFRRTPHVRTAWLAARLPTVFLQRWSMGDFWTITWQFFRIWPKIEETLKKAKPGEAYVVPFGRAWKLNRLEEP